MKIIVSRHEKDLQSIIKKYNLLYNQSLNDHLNVILLILYKFRDINIFFFLYFI